MRARFPQAAAVLLTLALPGWSAPAQNSPELPRVRLVATGGTISNKDSGRLTADELVKLMPNVGRYARPEQEQFSNLASSQLTLDQWIGLARRLNQIFTEDPGVAGVVVTSGTDTLEELAYFLDLTVRSAKPLVGLRSIRNPPPPGDTGAPNPPDGSHV